MSEYPNEHIDQNEYQNNEVYDEQTEDQNQNLNQNPDDVPIQTEPIQSHPQSHPPTYKLKSKSNSKQFEPVQLKNKLSKQQWKDMMRPTSSMNTPIKANNKQIIPTCNNKSSDIFQAKIHTVGQKGTIDLTDRFHSREDGLTYVNWSRRTYDLAPNSYRNEQYNTMQHQMHKHKNYVIYGDNTKRQKTTNYSFSDVGSNVNSITTPKHPKNFSKDYQTTTEWYKDTCQLKENDQQSVNGYFNTTTTKKPKTVTSWKGGTVNSSFIKDISKFSSLKLKFK